MKILLVRRNCKVLLLINLEYSKRGYKAVLEVDNKLS
jgi:hypothetical protein